MQTSEGGGEGDTLPAGEARLAGVQKPRTGSVAALPTVTGAPVHQGLTGPSSAPKDRQVSPPQTLKCQCCYPYFQMGKLELKEVECIQMKKTKHKCVFTVLQRPAGVRVRGRNRSREGGRGLGSQPHLTGAVGPGTSGSPQGKVRVQLSALRGAAAGITCEGPGCRPDLALPLLQLIIAS